MKIVKAYLIVSMVMGKTSIFNRENVMILKEDSDICHMENLMEL